MHKLYKSLENSVKDVFNQLTGFYTMATLAMNELRRLHMLTADHGCYEKFVDISMKTPMIEFHFVSKVARFRPSTIKK